METGVVHPLNTALGVLFSVCFMCVNLAPSTGACCNGCELGYECGVIVASRVRAGGVSGEGGGRWATGRDKGRYWAVFVITSTVLVGIIFIIFIITKYYRP